MHTPGPWTFYADLPSTDPHWHVVTTADRMRVVANVHIEPGNAVDAANASLIAAAPDMLAACKSVLESLERNLASDYLPETREAMRAAISKAEGGAS